MESGPGGPQPWGHLQLSLHYDLGSQKVRPRGAVGWWWVPGAGCRADRVLGTGGPWLSPSWLPDQGGPQAGGGPEGPGPGWHSRPLRLRPPLPRGWAQARDKGAPRHALPRVRRDLQLPGECGPEGGRAPGRGRRPAHAPAARGAARGRAAGAREGLPALLPARAAGHAPPAAGRRGPAARPGAVAPAGPAGLCRGEAADPQAPAQPWPPSRRGRSGRLSLPAGRADGEAVLLAVLRARLRPADRGRAGGPGPEPGAGG